MTLGKTPKHRDLFGSSAKFCEDRLGEHSIYKLLARDGARLFPDEDFADLFTDIGRCSVPPGIVATVMVLQRVEGLSDRDAVERFTFDARWKYAAGGLDFNYPGFVHTVLVDMRARLRRSQRPDRIFDAVLEVAKQAGLVGRKRVLDSTALYDAVATQDTVTMIRSAIRALLKVSDGALETELRGVLTRNDDYVSAGKPACEWDDAAAREALVDALARDANALIARLDKRDVSAEVKQAAELLATVVGQDVEQREDGLFAIVRGVATDRVISTVDPEARHGHKTAARGFDGYKGHVAVDPDSEIVTATHVTPGNVGDGSVAKELLKEVLDSPATPPSPAEPTEVYGDASYGTAEIVEHLEAAGADANVKVQAPAAPGGRFTKDRFEIDNAAGTVRCPNEKLVQIRIGKDGSGMARFDKHCPDCPLRAQCTDSKSGRNIRIHPHEETLQRIRQRQKDPAWRARYRATRPKVERKLAHMMARRHGGRRARMRGQLRVAHDFALLGAATNLKRLARLGVRHGATGWTM